MKIIFSEITSESSEKDSQIPAKNFKKDLHQRFLKESRESIDDSVSDVGNNNASTSNMGGNIAPQQARKFKKVQAKKLVKSNEIAFLAVLNFFPVQKLIFGHF